MKLLLDTHALVWWLFNDRRLGSRSRELIGDRSNEVAVSTISAFEIATKHRIGKWPEVEAIASDFAALVAAEDFRILPVDHAHALLAGRFPLSHKDPFDRIIAAQSRLEGMTLVTTDAAFQGFDVTVVW
ncbi:type II toxin-antitoxin system VapC family toxin [Rhizobium sp. SAFR-030]|uniref:type II toxin-antitoxin system VapC family toxin n=1 Tax=Rhizobium sp. SAFR-030 TaxID=3387277 RepID=UPI003F7F29AC